MAFFPAEAYWLCCVFVIFKQTRSAREIGRRAEARDRRVTGPRPRQFSQQVAKSLLRLREGSCSDKGGVKGGGGAGGEGEGSPVRSAAVPKALVPLVHRYGGLVGESLDAALYFGQISDRRATSDELVDSRQLLVVDCVLRANEDEGARRVSRFAVREQRLLRRSNA